MGRRSVSGAEPRAESTGHRNRRGDAPSDVAAALIAPAPALLKSRELARSAEPPDAGGAVARRRLDATLSARGTPPGIWAPDAV